MVGSFTGSIFILLFIHKPEQVRAFPINLPAFLQILDMQLDHDTVRHSTRAACFLSLMLKIILLQVTEAADQDQATVDMTEGKRRPS